MPKRGAPIGPLDTLIAAHALSLGWTLVTHNKITGKSHDRHVVFRSMTDPSINLLHSFFKRVPVLTSDVLTSDAVIESFWHSLKVELVHRRSFCTRIEAEQVIFEYIEVFYNRVRLHSSINYVPPAAFEAACAVVAA